MALTKLIHPRKKSPGRYSRTWSWSLGLYLFPLAIPSKTLKTVYSRPMGLAEDGEYTSIVSFCQMTDTQSSRRRGPYERFLAVRPYRSTSDQCWSQEEDGLQQHHLQTAVKYLKEMTFPRSFTPKDKKPMPILNRGCMTWKYLDAVPRHDFHDLQHCNLFTNFNRISIIAISAANH